MKVAPKLAPLALSITAIIYAASACAALSTDVVAVGTPATRTVPDPFNQGATITQLDSWLTTEKPVQVGNNLWDQGRIGHYNFNLNTVDPVTMQPIKIPVNVDILHAAINGNAINDSTGHTAALSYFTYKVSTITESPLGLNPDLYNGMLSKPAGIYFFTNFAHPAGIPVAASLPNQGNALDYYRHPGILNDTKGGYWDQAFNDVSNTLTAGGLWSVYRLPAATPNTMHNSDGLPPGPNDTVSGVDANGVPYFQAANSTIHQSATFMVQTQFHAVRDLDNLLSKATKVWVFGSGYVSSAAPGALVGGIHNVHLNQGNNDFFSGKYPNHGDDNGVSQDGALIIEYPSPSPVCTYVFNGNCIYTYPTLRATFQAKFSSNQEVTDDKSGDALPAPANYWESLPPLAPVHFENTFSLQPNSSLQLSQQFIGSQLQVELLEPVSEWLGWDAAVQPGIDSDNGLPAGRVAPFTPMSSTGLEIYVQNNSFPTLSSFRVRSAQSVRVFDDPAKGQVNKFITIFNKGTTAAIFRVRALGN